MCLGPPVHFPCSCEVGKTRSENTLRSWQSHENRQTIYRGNLGVCIVQDNEPSQGLVVGGGSYWPMETVEVAVNAGAHEWECATCEGLCRRTMNPYGVRCSDYATIISTIVSAERRVTRWAFGLTFEVELEIGLEFSAPRSRFWIFDSFIRQNTVWKSKVFVSLFCRIRFFFVIQNGFLL